jgi:hypothetical protein
MKRSGVVALIFLLAMSSPALATEWEPYFAWWPVWVDAYSQSEMENGKLVYRKTGWLERKLVTIDDEGERRQVWRYRKARVDQ